MSLDSKLRRARRAGIGTTLHHYEVATVCEAMRLLRACERHEAAEQASADRAAADQASTEPTAGLERFLDAARVDLLRGDIADTFDRLHDAEISGFLKRIDMARQPGPIRIKAEGEA